MEQKQCLRKVNIGDEAKVCLKWKVLPIDYTAEEAENIAVKFSKKYGISKSNIKVEPVLISRNEKGEEEEYSNEVITNIQNPEFQPKLFKQYLEEHGATNYDFNKIIEIDNLINNKIDYESYEKHKRYTIKWIKWDNFMSYGANNYFDFTGLKGLVLLSSEPANQGGKSTFCLDLLRFLLFGKVTSREDDWVLAKAFNRHLHEATEVVVEGCIEIDGVEYVIKRVISRPESKRRTAKSKVSQKVNYYKVINGEYVDLQDEDDVENEAGVSTRETNRFIKDAIGNERDFDLMICVNSDNLKGLISLKDTDRGRLLSRWVGLLPIEEKDKIAREYFNKTLMPSLYMNRYNKGEVSAEKEQLEQDNADYQDEIKTREKSVKSHTKSLNDEKQRRDELMNAKRDIDESLMKVDVETVKRTLETIKENGSKIRAEKEANEKKIEEIGKIDFNETEYKQMVADDKRMSINLSTMRSTCTSIKNEIEALKKGEFCPTCGARLKNVDNREKISAKQEEYDKLVKDGKDLKTEIEELEKEISNMDERREKYHEKQRLELKVEKNEVDIENLLAKYRENNRLLKDIQANEEAIAKNNGIEISIRNSDVVIKTEEARINELNREIEQYRTQIKSNEKNIENCNKIVGILEEEEVVVKHWKIYLELIGKNGISKMVLRTTLPLINAELKNLLNGVCDFDVEVVIDDHNDVTFNLLHDGEVGGLGSGSGFEQTVASLALRSVLSKISSFSKPSFVVFDEVLGGVADENYDNLKLLYDKIVKDYGVVIEITHLKAIADWHNTNIVITKENNVSKIKAR